MPFYEKIPGPHQILQYCLCSPHIRYWNNCSLWKSYRRFEMILFVLPIALQDTKPALLQLSFPAWDAAWNRSSSSLSHTELDSIDSIDSADSIDSIDSIDSSDSADSKDSSELSPRQKVASSKMASSPWKSYLRVTDCNW